MRIKKFLSVMLAVALLFSVIPITVTASAETTSGTTGDCTWTLDGTHLTISGNGKMAGYSKYTAPWGVNITTVTVKQGVTNIGSYAFYQCRNLTSTIIPKSVTSIGLYAFRGCTSLTSISIPDGVTSIDGFAFDGCTGITNIEIPNRVTSIGNYAFSWCENFTSIIIPNGVTNVGGYAFAFSKNLTSITIPDSVTSIGSSAFYHCNNLVIKTTENSTAHKYAVENDIDFELIVKPVTVEGDDKNITISTDSSVIPSTGVSLSTEKVENIGEKYETQLKNLGAEKFTAYNIDLMKGEEKVQPNGKVTVSIAVPDGMDGAKCKVYRGKRRHTDRYEGRFK